SAAPRRGAVGPGPDRMPAALPCAYSKSVPLEGGRLQHVLRGGQARPPNRARLSGDAPGEGAGPGPRFGSPQESARDGDGQARLPTRAGRGSVGLGARFFGGSRRRWPFRRVWAFRSPSLVARRTTPGGHLADPFLPSRPGSLEGRLSLERSDVEG